MNIREQRIIQGLRSEDERQRGDMVSALFYGKGGTTNQWKEILQRVVKICYGGPKYGGMYREIYETLVEMVCLDIFKASDAAIEGIKELKGYFFQTARNCANSNRKFIESSLGIDDKRTSLDDGDGKLPVSDDGEEDATGFFALLLFGGEDADLEGRSREDLARELVKRYIDRIPCENYRKVLYAIDLWGWSHERIEREWGLRNIDQNHRRARVALTKVALPDIKKTCGDYFGRHRDSLTGTEAALLDRFFQGETVPPDAAAKAYAKLVKVVRHDQAEFRKQMRRAVREEKAAQKESNQKKNR